jgi:hypothetical protein
MNEANAAPTQYRWLTILIIAIGASVIAAGIGLRIRELVEKVRKRRG